MATLLSIADGGNMMTASTWGVVEPTSFQGTPTVTLSSGLLSTTQFAGTAFTLASAVTLSGFALQLSGRAASPSGTLNVQLYNNTSATIVGQVTINVIDLPNSNGIGAFHIDWVYFKFASPITTVVGNSYSIRFQTSVASMISFYYTTGTSNINRALVTTTTQAPVTGDSLIIAGNYTSAGVNATTTVIMNDSGTIQTSTIWVSPKGIFKYLTTAGYTIELFIAGHLVIGVGGTFNIGTLSAPITQPTSSYVMLVMICTTALQYSIWVYGTFTTYGLAKTISSKLAADVAASIPVTITTDTTTGWSVGDNIIIPSTTQTYTQFEVPAINAISGTSVTLTGTLFAHGGNATTKVQADIVNVTRNILIVNNLNTARSNIQIFTNATVSCYYTTFQDFGTGVTVANSGICVNSLTSGFGSFDFQGNVVVGSPGLSTSANCGMFTVNDTGTTISNNIFYNLGWTTITPALSIYGINNNNYIIGCLTSGSNITCTYMGSNNVMTSNIGWNQCGFYNNATNNSFYSNNLYGLFMVSPVVTAVGNSGMNNFKIWRNNSNGILQSGSGANKNSIVTFDSIYMFGNLTQINNGGRTYSKILFTNSYFYGGSTLVAPSTIAFGNPNIPQDAIYFNNCYFGYSDSSLTPSPHSTSILQAEIGHSIIFNNCYFYGTEAAWNGGNLGVSNANVQTSQVSTNHNGITGSNKYWTSGGTITTDTIIYNTASPSLRLTPVSATWKLPTTTTKVAVKSGQTCSVSVKVRKSITADGVIYNGTAPRLIYCFNPIMGNMLETIGASYSSPTNLLQYPQNYEQSVWQKINATFVLGATAAPDGTSTATQITNTTNTYFRCNQTISVTPTIGSTYTYSSYIKQGSGRYVQVLVGDAGELYSTVIQYDFTLNTTSQLGVSYWTASNLSCVSVGNGWFRLSATLTVANVLVTSLKISGPGCAFGGGVTTTSGEYCYIWGSKLETGSALTAYVTDGGVWQTLTYTTPTVTNDGIVEFYVDCDGTTGWINVDDWSTTTFNDTRGTNYWGNSSVYIEADYKVPGASYTFFN